MKKLFIFLLFLFLGGMLTCKAGAEAPSNENPSLHNPSLHVFIHVCTINHWRGVLDRQLRVIKASGLYDRCESISLGILGDGDISPFIEKYPKLTVLFQNPDTSLYERPTLLCLHQVCVSNPNALVLYLHTKGVSKKDLNEIANINDWSRYMEYFAIERWKDCVKALKEHDACGVNWFNDPPHFSGNFWWATARYISTLPAFIESRYIAPELWIGKNAPKIKCFHHSHVLHYKERYPDLNYRDLDKQYVLAVTPGGLLGNQIKNYWNKVKNSDLRHKFIMKNPPHCKLTRNFTSNLTKVEFKQVLLNVLDEMKRRHIPTKIRAVNLVQGNPNQEMDYIELLSPFLMPFTQEFAKRQNLPIAVINGKNQPFRITLRKQTFKIKNKCIRIHRLQNNIRLQAPAKWSICIFKLNDEQLDLITSCTL